MLETSIKKSNAGKRILLTVLLTLLFVHCLGTFSVKLMNISSADGYRIDFIAYYTAAKLIEEGETEEIYVGVEDDFSVVTSGKYFETAKRAGFPYAPTRFLYLPLFATPFRLLTTFDFPTAANIWFAINLMCILAIIYLEWYLTKEFFPPVPGLIVIILLNLYSFPLLYGLTLGQTSILIYLIICFIFYCTVKSYDVSAGVSLGVITALKFSPLLFVLYFLYRKKYKVLIYCMFTLAGISFLSLIMYGLPLHKLYLRYLMRLSNMSIAGWSNQSIEAILLRLFTDNTLVYFYPVKAPPVLIFIRYTVTILLIGAVYLCGRGTNNVNLHQRYPLEFSSVALCMLIMPSISWLHYFNVATLSVILISAYCFTTYSARGLIIIFIVLMSYVLIAYHPDYTALVNCYGQGILIKAAASFPFIGASIMLLIQLALLKDKRCRSQKL